MKLSNGTGAHLLEEPMPDRKAASGALAMRDALRRAKRHAFAPDAIYRTHNALADALSDPVTRVSALLLLAEFLSAVFEGVVIDPDHLEVTASSLPRTGE